MSYIRYSGIGIRPIDLNREFLNLNHQPVLINHFNMAKPEERERLKELMFTYYDDTSLEIVPSCKGGHIKGDSHIGKRCKICQTEVTKPPEEIPESLLWFKVPDGIGDILTPIAWSLLSKVMTYAKSNMLEWLVNPNYKTVGSNPKLLKFRSLIAEELPDLKRGVTHFYENFDRIWSVLYKAFSFRGDAGDKKKWVEANVFVGMYRNILFTRYIPFPSRLLFVIESTPYTSYGDKRMFIAFNAMNQVAGLEVTEKKVRAQESRIAKCVSELSLFYSSFVKEVLGKKPGMFRGHVYAGRGNFTARAVITSISEPHEYDECELPWAVSLKLLEPMIWNRLINRYSFSSNEAVKYTRDHAQKSSDIINAIFDDLLMSTKHKGIPVIIHRNPSLDRLSMQQLFVMWINRDPYSSVFRISNMILTAPNADFDGDQLNCKLTLDDREFAVASRIHPSMGALSIETPRMVSSAVQQQPETVAMLMNYLAEGNKLCGVRPNESECM